MLLTAICGSGGVPPAAGADGLPLVACHSSTGGGDGGRPEANALAAAGSGVLRLEPGRREEAECRDDDAERSHEDPPGG